MGWGWVGDAVGAVGDAAKGVVDTVTDTVEGAADVVLGGIEDGLEHANGWICVNGPRWACETGNLLIGGVKGAIGNVRGLIEDAAKILRCAAEAASALLHGDLCKFVNDLENLAANAVKTVIDAIRTVTLGYIVGGWLDARDRAHLRGFISQRLEDKFSHDPGALHKIREHIGLDRASYGLPIKAEHYVWRLDSLKVDLAKWHNDGTVDLYALAHLFSGRGTCEIGLIEGPAARTVVKSVDTNGIEDKHPIFRSQLKEYIESNGKIGRIRVYAMEDRAISDKIRIAAEKCKRIGVKLIWNDSENFPQFNQYTVRDISDRDHYRFRVEDVNGSISSDLDKYLREDGLRATSPGQNNPEECTIVAIGAFRYSSDKYFGATSGRTFKEGIRSASCTTPADRTDQCCVTVASGGGSGVIHRDLSPYELFDYVLAHEIGHYLGLCHIGHNTFANIMWSPKAGDKFGQDLLNFYHQSSPYFTLADGKNAWRFLIDQLPQCLTGDRLVPAPTRRARQSASMEH